MTDIHRENPKYSFSTPILSLWSFKCFQLRVKSGIMKSVLHDEIPTTQSCSLIAKIPKNLFIHKQHQMFVLHFFFLPCPPTFKAVIFLPLPLLVQNFRNYDVIAPAPHSGEEHRFHLPLAHKLDAAFKSLKKWINLKEC